MFPSNRPILLQAGVLALLCLAQHGKAEDLPSKKEAPTAFTWTGFYVGFNSGYAWTASPTIGVVSANVLDNSLLGWGPASAVGASGVSGARLDGFFFGGQAGYNWQFTDKLVAGFEADIQGAGVRGGGGIANVIAAPAGFAVTSATLRRSLDYFGTARGRLGYALTPNLLVYATGGLAFGGVNASASIAQSLTPSALLGTIAKGDVFENRAGWVAGAGFEWAFARNLSAKLEYVYYDLGGVSLTHAQTSPLAFRGLLLGDLRLADATNVTTRYNAHTLRGGLNYRFDCSVPPTSETGATQLFASPQLAPLAAPSVREWRVQVMPYLWALNVNGDLTARDQTVSTNATIIDAITKSSSAPLAFMGRVEAQNGPFSAYGDFAWVQLRFSGSTLKLRSPLADLVLATSSAGHMKMTMAIGEAGGAYELARFKLVGALDGVTTVDAYAGIRYWYVGLDLSLQELGAANAGLLGLERKGALAVARSGAIQWVDPVIGARVRHALSPTDRFETRGDIGGFGANSKFSWEFYGGYSHDFTLNGLNLSSTVGYRALSVDYSRFQSNHIDGINAVIHGPVTGLSMRF